jgi:hypothetical protein
MSLVSFFTLPSADPSTIDASAASSATVVVVIPDSVLYKATLRLGQDMYFQLTLLFIARLKIISVPTDVTHGDTLQVFGP